MVVKVVQEGSLGLSMSGSMNLAPRPLREDRMIECVVEFGSEVGMLRRYNLNTARDSGMLRSKKGPCMWCECD